MTAALLNCENDWEQEHVRPCVTSLACWWKEIRELEILLGYNRSTLAACQAWDEILASEIPSPCEALYAELRACVGLWHRLAKGRRLSRLNQFSSGLCTFFGPESRGCETGVSKCHRLR